VLGLALGGLFAGAWPLVAPEFCWLLLSEPLPCPVVGDDEPGLLPAPAPPLPDGRALLLAPLCGAAEGWLPLWPCC
jgi:hypothetical protein